MLEPFGIHPLAVVPHHEKALGPGDHLYSQLACATIISGGLDMWSNPAQRNTKDTRRTAVRKIDRQQRKRRATFVQEPRTTRSSAVSWPPKGFERKDFGDRRQTAIASYIALRIVWAALLSREGANSGLGVERARETAHL